MGGLKEMRKYGKLKEEALDSTLWRTRFGRSYGSVVSQSSQRKNEWLIISCVKLHFMTAGWKSFSDNNYRQT
jgi:hypothetical protein